jgi:hypothetical protein
MRHGERGLFAVAPVSDQPEPAVRAQHARELAKRGGVGEPLKEVVRYLVEL